MKRLQKTPPSKKKFIFGISMILMLSAMVGTSLAYLFTQTTSLVNTFFPALTDRFDLVVEKTITHPFEEGYPVPAHLTFDFRVELGPDYAGQTVETSQGNMVADEKGNITLTGIPHNGKASVNFLPEGMTVRVVELESEWPGFTAARAQNVTITERFNTAEFVNPYQPGPADAEGLTLNVTKLLDGRDWEEGDNFTFRLERQSCEGEWINLGVEEISFDTPDHAVDMTALLQAEGLLNQLGTIPFRVIEVDGEGEGILHEASVGYFDVAIADADMDGYMEISEVRSGANCVLTENEDGWDIHLTITNYYANAAIQITKVLEDKNGETLSPAGFSFELYNEQGDLVAVSDQTSAAGTVCIPLRYDQDDAGESFGYTLKEKFAGQTLDGVTYDDTVYDIVVTVYERANGSLAAAIYNVGEEPDYFTEPAALGGAPVRNETATEPTQDPTEPSDEEETVIIIDLPQQATLGEQGQSETGTEPETEPETEAASETETEAETETETETETGTEAETQDDSEIVPDDEEEESSESVRVPEHTYYAQFRNVYEPEDAVLEISAMKYLSGRDLVEGEFTFHLFETNAKFTVLSNAEPIDITDNSSKGHVDFQPLTFSETGTYYYVVLEDDFEALGGITYDKTRYHLTVVVTDNGMGHLSALCLDTEGEEMCVSGDETEIIFENTYQVRPGFVSIPGLKILMGNKALATNAFIFDLYLADENFDIQGGEPIKNVRNLSDGTFDMEWTIAEEGIYHYVVRENATKPIQGVTYDQMEYHVTVEVIDNGRGRLEAEILSLEAVDGEERYDAEELRFINTYSAADTNLVLSGRKILNGANLSDGMFQFKLCRADENFNPVGEDIRTAVNDTRGNFTFDTITLSSAGTHYFVVYESAEEKMDRVSYDQTVYGVAVEVVDNGKGSLKVENKRITVLGGEETGQITFTNEYHPLTGDAALVVTAEKSVENRGDGVMSPEGFEFVLYRKQGNTKTVLTSDADGLAPFELNFSEADAGMTYDYTLQEVKGNKADVTYDRIVYAFQIHVDWDENENLVAELSMDGQQVESTVFPFVNIYDSDEDVDPEEPDDPGSGDGPIVPGDPNVPPPSEVPSEPGTPSEPDTPSEPGSGDEPGTPPGEAPGDDDPSSPKTGDSSRVMFFMGMMFMTGMGLFMLVFLMDDEEEEA